MFLKNTKLLLVGLLFTGNLFAQNRALADFEQKTKHVIQKVYPACVRICGYDTIRNVQNSSQFSGVVVSAEGHILTVAHAIKPQRIYKVLFPDGNQALAVALGRVGLADMQNRPDLGMMKILTKGIWPIAEIGYSNNLKINQPCLSISYPESLNQSKPTVRLGRIFTVKDQFGFLNSTCKMEPGDSGGALFDFNGRVIALHSRCMESEEKNLEVPIDLYRKYWKPLQLAEDYQVLPSDTVRVAADPLISKISFPDFRSATSNLSLGSAKSAMCLTITSSLDGASSKVNGTLLRDGDKCFVLSKSSMVHEYPHFVIGNRTYQATILARDKTNDLVLLQSKENISGGVPLSSLYDYSRMPLAHIGSLILSALPEEQRISLLSTEELTLPRKFSAGFLGGPARYIDSKITLSVPVKESPAELAGLKQGDIITAIAGVELLEAADYGAEMIKYNPGDTVEIKVTRMGGELVRKIRLVPRPVGSHVADQFAGGKSIRLDGFSNVFSHDGIITPAECGGPVFDIHGNFYGINIARFSRTTTLVMPVSVLNAFICKALGQK